jgi:hypothetical protein
MSKSEQNQLREQRLAAKLRENLKRRKEQARARAAGTISQGVAEAGPEAPETDTSKKP